jgi:uncharacterized protein (DUF924 family)
MAQSARGVQLAGPFKLRLAAGDEPGRDGVVWFLPGSIDRHGDRERRVMNSAIIDDILGFWFGELTYQDWFRRDEAIDATIASRFGGVYHELRDGVPEAWLQTPRGVLAAILVLDQFPRNMFRDDARAFATDDMALALAKQAIADGMDETLTPDQRAFIYMPLQHSEDDADQALSVGLYAMLGIPLNLDFALRHKAVIDRFGRFPHRNAVLGRQSTEAEAAFLAAPGPPF